MYYTRVEPTTNQREGDEMNSELLATAIVANDFDTTAQAAYVDAVQEEGGEAGFLSYTPEMGDKKPVAHMEARLAHYGKHYFIDTPLTLSGRGIVHQDTYTAKTFTGGAAHRKCGWNCYKVTLNAMEKLRKQYRVSHESLLD